MKWPWVSRLSYDLAVETGNARLADAQAQITQLREQNEKLTNHLVRMDRVEHGKPEEPRAPREPIGPIPPDLLKHCNSFQDPTICKALRDRAFKRRIGGETWADIKADMMRDEEGNDGPREAHA